MQITVMLITKTIKLLMEKYEIISRIRPIHSPPGTMRVKYKIDNPFLNFWFRYIDRYRATIELGNYEAVQDYALADYSVYSGHWLESYFRQQLAESKKYTHIGQWWNSKDGQDEIDIVAENEFTKNVMIVEVKRNANKFKREQFEKKAAVLIERYYKAYEVEMAVLSLDDM